MSTIQDTVNESLDNAKDNGFFDEGASLHGMDAHAIANDLIEYDAACGDFEAAQLIGPVEKWMEANGRA